MKKAEKYLPLTESTAYILMSLDAPLHGYGLMQKVTELSDNTVTIGPGTLYTAFATLEKQGLIAKAGQDGRRKLYELTDFGRIVLTQHMRRTAIMLKSASAIIDVEPS